MNAESMTKNESRSKDILTDIKAGLVVFLIAIPLSLGISLASGAPSSAGLISAILGGMLGAYLGGSYVTINGPAAGLIVVVLSAIQSLGAGDPALGFRRMLACIIVVGVLQILSGLLKAGRFVSLFPVSVVHGMLTAIGLIIMIKQIHVFLGLKSLPSIIGSITQIPVSFINLHPESALIGLASILLLLAYPHIKLSFTKVIPAPLVVVMLGVGMSFYLIPAGLVTIPTQARDLFVAPLFDAILTRESIIAIVTIYFVASLESILSASAVDKLDPQKRESDFDRELWSKGVVNLACGLLGGLPIIAEIVRSSANITQGAKSPLSNFSHGFFILVFVLAFPTLLNMIPLSALAAILLLVGYRLAQPKQFKEMWQMGMGSFLGFTTTIVFTLAEDLLVGVAAGIVAEALYSFYLGASLKTLLSPSYKMEIQGDEAILSFEDSLTFFSVLKQKSIIHQAERYKRIKIDLSRVRYIDVTSLFLISKESLKIERAGVLVHLIIPQEYQPLYLKTREH